MPNRTWNSSYFIRGQYLHLHKRQTGMSCSLQTAKQPHGNEIVMWVLKHKDQWREYLIYFSGRLRGPDDILQLNRLVIPFVNNVVNLGVTFDSITLGHHIERTAAKALHMYIRTYFIFKCGCLSKNAKLMLLQTTDVSYSLCLSHLGVCNKRSLLETAALAQQGTPHYLLSGRVSKVLMCTTTYLNCAEHWQQ
jgi:hypothetical protein